MLAQNADIVQVSPYNDSVSNIAIGSATSSLEMTLVYPRWRIRQSGPISRVKIHMLSLADISAVYFKVWRKLGPGPSAWYYLIGQSENILPSLIVGINTIDLSSPVDNCLEGDICGVRFETSAPAVSFLGASNSTPTNSLRYTIFDAAETSPVAWQSQTLQTPSRVFVEAWAQAPHIVFIGDSLMAGTYDHGTAADIAYAADPWESWRPSSTTPYMFASIVRKQTGEDIIYQNMAIGSQTTTQIAARFTNDVVNMHPRYAVIEGGMNDLVAGELKATVIANFTAMLDACDSNSIIPIVMLIYPSTVRTNEQMQTRDDWNPSIQALADGHPSAIVVDVSRYIGQFRAGGDAGNLWDLNPRYDGGQHGHPNRDGYFMVAKAIADKFIQPASRKRAL